MLCLLDGSDAVLETPPPAMPSAFLVREAQHAWERREAFALRRAVFCVEQGLFQDHAGDDRDALDDHAQLLVAMACEAGVPDQVVGTVRIHETEPGIWWGGRLAVHAAFRRQGQIGATLIRLAVTRAHAQGCSTFLAHVQAQNQALFEKLGWRTLAALKLHGRPHDETAHRVVAGRVDAQVGLHLHVRPRSIA